MWVTPFSTGPVTHYPVLPARPAAAAAAPPSPRLIPTVRRAFRLRHYSQRTEKAYVSWIRRFIRYHGLRHPAELGAPRSSVSCPISPSWDE